MMVQDGGNGNGEQSTRDFLALSHGHEWTNFYDSFDKLVQDNLSRSSELLRHAMSLPEVADREVSEVKAEMAAKLKAERNTAKDAFSSLHQEMLASKQQAEALTVSLSTMFGDFSRLTARLAELVQSYEASDEEPEAEPVAVATSEPVAAAPEDAWTALADEVEVEPVAEVEVEEQSVAEPVSAESEELSWDADVSFADVVGGDAAESEEEDSDGSSSPQRPAWLSVARQSAAS
jgi:hypothetical protein